MQLDDPGGVLEGEGDRMKHLTLREGDPIPADELAGFVRQAVELNAELGSPAGRADRPGRLRVSPSMSSVDGAARGLGGG